MKHLYSRLSLLLFSISFLGCNQTPKETDEAAYELVTDWPQLSPGYKLSQPTALGVDSDDHIFVFHRTGRGWSKPFPDSLISLNTILELDNATGKILNSWGANEFIMPHGLNVDKDNNVWVTDVALNQVFKFSHDGKLLMTLGVAKVSGDDSLHFNLPTDVAVANDGSFYISDGYGNSRVVKFSAQGKYLLAWGKHGNKEGEFDIPHGITLDSKGNVYVADRQNNRIQIFNSKGIFQRVLSNNESVAQLPSVIVDDQQNLFAIDYDVVTSPDTSIVKGSTIFKYDTTGKVLFKMGAQATSERIGSYYHDVTVDKQGNIYACDLIGKRVLKFKKK